MNILIKEGDEYRITRCPDRYTVYQGIAESDTDAEDRLESYALHYRAMLNVAFTITLKIEKVS